MDIEIVLIVFSLLLFIFGIIVLFIWKKSSNFISQLTPSIKKFHNEILSVSERYISNTDQRNLHRNYRILNEQVKTLSNKTINNNEDIKLFYQIYKDLEIWVIQSNKLFIEREFKEMELFFQNIDGKSLDMQQQEACIVDEDNVLVLAGAGSGKTLTISAKVKYLTEKLNVHPNDILLISFTAKSANEMTERINNKLNIPVEAKTFHKLGLSIITNANKRRPEIYTDFNKFINNYFSNNVQSNPSVIRDIVYFYSSFLSIPKNLEDFETLSEYYHNQSTLNLVTLRSKVEAKKVELQNKKTTLKFERVKSLEEVLISNFLYLNGVDYEYEKEYPYKGDNYRKKYRPDFYLPEYDLYLEHFGITEDSKAPWLSEIEEKKYLEDMRWKRNWHKQNGTVLLESYSYFNKNGLLLEKLKSLLLKHKVSFRPIDLLPVYKELTEKQDKENEFKEFKKLISTFITLYKSNGYDEEQFLKMKVQLISIENPFLRERTQLFLSIVHPIYMNYQEELFRNHSIDFNDMINQAAEIIENTADPMFKYKYIIIDEYQDIAMGRYRLIKALKEISNAKIFAVGDDWQSIFRFAGSDLQLFIDFEKYFGFTKLLKIERTYRNSQELIDVAAQFVMKNNKQLNKKLKSSKTFKKPIKIYGYDKNNLKAFSFAIDDIVKHYGTNSEITIIGRNNFDLKFMIDREKDLEQVNVLNLNVSEELKQDYKKRQEESKLFTYQEVGDNKILKYEKYPNVLFRYSTVHRSKGLEADNVIIINMVNHLSGFPNKISDDPLLSLVTKEADDYQYAEERRLFYVALTRTKNSTYLIAPQYDPSFFIEELVKNYDIHFELVTGEDSFRENPKCPVCKTGILIVRENTKDKNKFVGCSNYPSCSQTYKELDIIKKPIVCISCGGYMLKRSGKNGEFYGCSNYPFCKNSLDSISPLALELQNGNR